MASLEKIQMRHARLRKRIAGTAERPRLAVHFSGKNIYAQVIDDVSGRTLAAAATTEKGVVKTARANCDCAAQIGKLVAERSKKAKVEQVVFDRGGFQYHGKVKALADAAREGGLQF